ncbi:MAG: hypothetical protein P4L75_07520 [Clostridia bacterium]|nr:hypothetical protein [Clostridia bacterium]MDR3644319.1 hypothetical protein [Clostridia bacterium]
MFKAKLVVMAQPCTACVIINSLNMESLERVAAQCADFSWELVQITHPRRLKTVAGLEVEKLPAVIVDGEQLTAGSVLPPRRLLAFLEELRGQPRNDAA